MAADNCEVLTEETIGIVTSLLTSTSSQSQFMEKWAEIARHLNLPNTDIKKLRDKRQDKSFTEHDVLADMLEMWTGRCSPFATISTLATVFEKNGFKPFAESLRDRFCNTKCRNYCHIPLDVEDFLKREAKYIGIICTPDADITCRKIRENRKCSFHRPEEILQHITHSTSNMEQLYVVHKCEIKNIIEENICSVLFQRGSPFPKLAIVTDIKQKKEVWKFVNSDSVRKSRVQVCEDTMRWEDLTLPHQNIIAKRMEERFQFQWDLGYLGNILNGQVLAGLINDKELNLFKPTVPKEMSSYIDCYLETRNVVSANIFSHNCSDVFLINGLDEIKLSIVASNELTDTTANQIKQNSITVRILLLEQSDMYHFFEICERTQAPVHVLHYDNNNHKIKWQKSRGSIRTIQAFLEDDSNNLIEEFFFKQLPWENNFPICISGCSGSGMSAFLARAGQILSNVSETDARKWIIPQINQNRTVIYTTVKKFISKLRNEERSEKGPSKRAILKTLENLICQNELDKSVLKLKLETQGVSLEILLDSFDEVDSLHLHFAYSAFQKITSFKSIRLWVTCRTQWLSELENRLRVLSYRLNSFCPEHATPCTECNRAIRYLKVYWLEYIKYSTHLKKPSAGIDEKQLEHYAEECLSSYVASAPKNDSESDGVFLKYFQLAKLHEHEAAKFGAGNKPNKIPVSSNLFQVLIDNRIDSYLANQNKRIYGYRTLMDMHVILGLRSIFQNNILAKPEGVLQPVPYTEIFKVGLLKEEGNEESPLFIHISFAEYFVIQFIIKELIRNPKSSQPCKPDRGDWKMSLFPRFQICYLIETLLLSKQHIIPCQLIKLDVFDDEAKLQRIALTCAERNFVNIFKLLKNFKAFSKYKKAVFSQPILETAVDNSCLEFVKLILLEYDKINSGTDNIKLKIALLRTAVTKGNFDMVELFIKTDNMIANLIRDRSLHQQNNCLKDLMHHCVENTNDKPAEEIAQRKKIVYFLTYQNNKLLKASNRSGKIPIDSNNIHKKLVEAILEANAYVVESFK